jgi:hypothetical protein
MPSSGAFWRIRRRRRAEPLDKEEPRIPLPRTPVNRGKKKAQGMKPWPSEEQPVWSSALLFFWDEPKLLQ